MKLENNIKTMLELVLANNQNCQVGIFYQQRIFFGNRAGKHELLVLLSTGSYADIWGHVAYIHQKWTSSLLNVTAFFGGNTDLEVIDDFWVNIKDRVGWNSVNLDRNSKDVAYSDSFNEGAKALAELIKTYAFGEGNSLFDIYDVYGLGPMMRDCCKDIRSHSTIGPGSHERRI
jgi:hypothetical protein